MSDIRHTPVCSGCGALWPCRPHMDRMNELRVVASVSNGDYTLEYQGMGEEVRVAAPGGYTLPVSHPVARAALEAIGWVYEPDGSGMHRP